MDSNRQTYQLPSLPLLPHSSGPSGFHCDFPQILEALLPLVDPALSSPTSPRTLSQHSFPTLVQLHSTGVEMDAREGQCPLRAILDYPKCYLLTSQSISSWKGWTCVPGCYSEKFHFLQLIRWDPWPFLPIGQEEQTGMETVSSLPHSPPYLSSRKQSLAHSVFFLLTFPCSKGRQK